MTYPGKAVRSPVRSIVRSPVSAITGSGGWTPAELFTTFSGAWYDPSDLTTLGQTTSGPGPITAGDTVAYLGDKSGGGNHATQATGSKQPILTAESGFYSLTADGVDDAIKSSLFASAMSQPHSIAMACRWDVSGGLMVDSIAGGAKSYIVHSANNISANAGTSVAASPAVTAPTGWRVVVVEYNGASSKLRVDGVETTGDMGTNGRDGLGLFNGSTNGRLGELICIDGQFGSDLTTVEQYLADKHGVTLA